MRRFLTFAGLALAACQAAPPQSTTGSPPVPADTAHAWAAFDRAGVRRSGAGGLAERRHGRRATVADPARVASVSKLVVALGAMRLVEQGRLDLDADVSRWLGWELRNPAFPDTAITMRMLLSHTSSLQDAGEAYVIPLGRTVRGAIADTVFDRSHEPGTYFRYANLNFPVVASVLERLSGERFDRLMHRLVMAPLGLDACFNWTTCSDAKVARAVTLYRADGSVALDDLQGQRPPCPVFRQSTDCDLANYMLGDNGALFSPQGGFRASVLDLAAIGRLLLNRGRHDGRVFLSEAGIETILRPVWTFDGTNGDTSDGFYCAYGLAAQTLPVREEGCNDDLLGDGRRLAGHAGDAYNLRSGLWIDRERNVGIAYFAANNPAPPPPGRSAFLALEEWLAARIGN
ncbi:MAG TPA: serine hydrolase [Allosphingosinicella sp.]|nr:serine hydrolase [Allosphingosinicella sp.]